MFVVVEGVDGAGKSTQCRTLAARWRAAGHEVVETFEPGATPAGAAMRRLLLDSDLELTPLAEALLMAADRAQHVAEVVAPALARGARVVSDRFLPSSLAYQGVGRGLGVEVVDALNRPAVEVAAPDAVVVLDVDPRLLPARRDGTDRFEAANGDFLERVRRAYLDLAPERGWIVIDGSGGPDAVSARVDAALAT